MAYQDYHWNRYGVTCTSDSVWVPGTGGGDVNDGTRDQITNAYYSLFGRYGELGGIEYHVDLWVNKGRTDAYGTYASIEEMVKHTGNSAEGGTGEWNNVQNIGKHTGLAPGFCPTPPTPTPTPILRPHVNINGSWYRSRDVYIKDNNEWKLCVAGYVKDGGEWKPFIQNAQALTSPGGGGGSGDSGGGGPTPTTYTIIPVTRYKNNVDDHFCTTGSAPGGYISEGVLCYVFSTQAPGTSPIFDDDDGDRSTSGRPYSGVMGYAYLSKPSNVSTKTIYALTNNDTMWSEFTSEGDYSFLRTEFYAPTQNLTV